MGHRPQTGFEDGLNRVHAGVIENWWGVGRSAEFKRRILFKVEDYTI